MPFLEAPADLIQLNPVVGRTSFPGGKIDLFKIQLKMLPDQNSKKSGCHKKKFLYCCSTYKLTKMYTILGTFMERKNQYLP